MNSDEETVCGVCGASFSQVHVRTTGEPIVGNARWLDARRVMNRQGLINLGAWLALLVSGLGLVVLTVANAPNHGSYYYSRFGGGALLGAGFLVGIVLIVLAIGSAIDRLRQ